MANRREVRHLLVINNDLAYNPQAARNYFTDLALECDKAGKRAVFSSERLVGNVLTGHYDMQAIAIRLNKVFDQPRIMLMIRNQMPLIASIYRQYLKVGGSKTFEQFIQPGEGRIPVFDWRAYEFHRLVEFYQELFGRENLFVVALEQITADPEIVLQNMCKFFDVEYCPPSSTKAQNKGLTDNRLKVRRRINSVFRPKMPNLRDSGRPGLSREGILFRMANGLEQRGLFDDENTNLIEEVESNFSGKYAKSNRRLAELIDFDFAAAGYEI